MLVKIYEESSYSIPFIWFPSLYDLVPFKSLAQKFGFIQLSPEKERFINRRNFHQNILTHDYLVIPRLLSFIEESR